MGRPTFKSSERVTVKNSPDSIHRGIAGRSGIITAIAGPSASVHFDDDPQQATRMVLMNELERAPGGQPNG